jgi:hypothetical protein
MEKIETQVTVITLKSPRTTSLVKIEAQRGIVRKAYNLTNSLNSIYVREFDKLSDMINELQAEQFRKQFGVTKTPYDNKECKCNTYEVRKNGRNIQSIPTW